MEKGKVMIFVGTFKSSDELYEFANIDIDKEDINPPFVKALFPENDDIWLEESILFSFHDEPITLKEALIEEEYWRYWDIIKHIDDISVSFNSIIMILDEEDFEIEGECPPELSLVFDKVIELTLDEECM